MTPLLRSARRELVTALTVAALAACDDPAELAQDVVAARGECDQDSLKASSEACVQMFERYGAMATEAIHTYIGGMKAMDQALDRMPPAGFDTAGLGHAITVPLERAGADGISAGTIQPSSPYDASRLRRAPIGAYGEPVPGEYDAAAAGDEAWGDPSRRPATMPAAQRGVLRPPAERLDRPWLRDAEDEYEDERPVQPPRYVEPSYADPAFDERFHDEPPYEQPRSRPSPRKQ